MYGDDSLYTLVLLRHGESLWNRQNRYTGWCDVPLTKTGESEARSAGKLLYENGIELDAAYTSVLKRASFTTNMALNHAMQHWVPVTKTWRLNERHYGALQGFEKDTAYKELNLDQELVYNMRRSYDTRPPIMSDDHDHWHGNDRRYGSLTSEQLEATRGESLKDAAERVMPFFNGTIVPDLLMGKKVLVVSHANTLRALIKQIDNIDDEDIKSMSIPTGIPLLYRLDANLRPVDPVEELEIEYKAEPRGYTWGTSKKHGFNGVYLGDIERLKVIQRKRDLQNRDWQRIILKNIFQAAAKEDDSSTQQIVQTRQLWWKVHEKMGEDEFSNMILLKRCAEMLEELSVKRQREITVDGFNSILKKLHLDAEGEVITPFEKVDKTANGQNQATQKRRKIYDLEFGNS